MSTVEATTSYPAPFIVNPVEKHNASLIFLHGRGDSGPAFGSMFYVSEASSGFTLAQCYPGLRFIFPTTAHRWSTTFSEIMPEWFDTCSLTYPEKRSDLQVKGLREAVGFIHGLIADELASGIPAERIFLGGISQGCATALHVMLSFDKRLGGFIGIAGWMPFESVIRSFLEVRRRSTSIGDSKVDGSEEIKPSKHAIIQAMNFIRTNLSLPPLDPTTSEPPECLKTPVYLCHGDHDWVVDPELGRKTYGLLKKLGMDPVMWEDLEGTAHWYKVPETIDSIIEFWGTKADLLPS